MTPSFHSSQKYRGPRLNGRRLRWSRVIPMGVLALLILGGGVFVGVRLIQSRQPQTARRQGTTAVSRANSSSQEHVASSQTDSAVGGVPVGVSPPAGEKIAYLTFDDGPTKYTPQVLSVLSQNGVKATFFIAFMSEDSQAKRTWVQQEAAAGMAIGVHSWTHNYSYIYANEQNFESDFTTMRQIITSVTGTAPTICRFPGGVGNTISLKYHGNAPIMPTLVNYVEQLGVKPFDWTAGGEDADTPRPATGQAFADKIMKDIGTNEHPIILMHDRYAVTVSALPIVIQQLKAKGYAFSTLSLNMKSVTQSPVLSRKSGQSVATR